MAGKTIIELENAFQFPPANPGSCYFPVMFLSRDNAEKVHMLNLYNWIRFGLESIYKGDWNDTDIYQKGDIVSHDDQLWWYRWDTPGNHSEPNLETSDYWLSLSGTAGPAGPEGPPGEGSYDDTDLQSRVSVLEGYATDFESRISALESAVSDLQSGLSEAQANIAGIDSRVSALEGA